LGLCQSRKLRRHCIGAPEKLLDRDKWDEYMLLRLVYAEEMEERLMALLKSKK
jgi:hypothetical protein